MSTAALDALWGPHVRSLRHGRRLVWVAASPKDHEPEWTQDADVRPVATFAVSEVRNKVVRIPTASMNRAVRDQVEDFLTRVTDARSTVPSVAPTEEGSAILHWVAGHTSIEVEIDAAGPKYLWAARVDGTHETLTDDPAAIEIAARRLVADMAARVNALNPRWRYTYLGR